VQTQDPQAYADALRAATQYEWDEQSVRNSAVRFAPEHFRDGLGKLLDGLLGPRWKKSSGAVL
jgi:hypothetical protein